MTIVAVFFAGAGLGGLLRYLRDQELIREYREQSRRLLHTLEQTMAQGPRSGVVLPVNLTTVKYAPPTRVKPKPYLPDSAVALPGALLVPSPHPKRSH